MPTRKTHLSYLLYIYRPLLPPEHSLFWMLFDQSFLTRYFFSLAMLTHWPLRYMEVSFTTVFFKLILQIDIFRTSSEIGPRWVSLSPIEGKSTLGQVMVWCCQTTSHFLNQCWPRTVPPYGVTRTQWVNPLSIPLMILLICYQIHYVDYQLTVRFVTFQ